MFNQASPRRQREEIFAFYLQQIDSQNWVHALNLILCALDFMAAPISFKRCAYVVMLMSTVSLRLH